ncbi:MAG: type 1 glutamine amidotransferase [Hydrogenophaga sp.]|uniref:type 1 glutamine amidotransferase n=1 Tax=Hydrogenophaga sp. TaxID=1904254 RepID=UPI002AB8B367|nr:type 1 glutamine amidotransferase [Hydrogenophaga sp.]MDZ4189611.1 type 1 glutamine amidotransferase [Hydrogenophaga sp.]
MNTPINDSADVLVLQHLNEDGPGYLGQWLDEQGARWQVRCAEAGDVYPHSVRGYRGLAVLGGAWSANDERPTLRQAEALIQEADALGIPVIGHCLGGQLMARAFGGRVERQPQPEVGWLPMRHTGSETSRAWLGDAPDTTVYQWHQDSFVQLPADAELLACSPACAHQAFALRQHLAMQFHIEITPAKIAAWLTHPGEAYPLHVLLHPDSVQDPARMHAATALHLAGSQALAARIYGVWRSRWAVQAL